MIQVTFAPAAPDRRTLDARARALGFADLAGYLTERYLVQERSLIGIAEELGVTIHIVRGLRDALGLLPHGGVRARGRSQQAVNDQRAAARAAELGFGSLRAYLTDRYTDQAWTIPQLAAELGLGAHVAQRLLRGLRVTRTRATASIAAAARRGRARQAELVAQRRQARLAELGFVDLAGYLTDRVVSRGWSLWRVRAELRVSKAWLRGEAVRLGIMRLVQPVKLAAQ